MSKKASWRRSLKGQGSICSGENKGRGKSLVQTGQQQIIWQMLKQCLIQIHHGLSEMIIQTRFWIPGLLYLLAM